MKYISPTTNACYQQKPEKRMGEAAMMGKAEDRVLEISEDVDIRSFRRQRHRGRSQRRLPVEAGTGKAGSGKKVSDRFQICIVAPQ